MAGTRAGGIKVRKTLMDRYGEDYFTHLGRKGGQVKGPKGFAKMEKERLYEVSARGGKSRPQRRISNQER